MTAEANHAGASLVATMQEFVGEPTSHWIGESTWIPAEGSRMYTTDEFRDLFGKECTLFVGDSLQRRVADTLHLMLSVPPNNDSRKNKNNSIVLGNEQREEHPDDDITHHHQQHLHTPLVDDAVFTDEFFRQKWHDRGFRQRDIPFLEQSFVQADENSTISSSRRRMGCIDTDWRPTLEDVQTFANDYANDTIVYGDYTVVVVGSTIWDVVGSSRIRTSAEQLRQRINATLIQLRRKIPSHVKIIWKSSGWCDNCGWTVDETLMNRGDNYKVFAANQQAQITISNIINTTSTALPAPTSLRSSSQERKEENPAATLVYMDWGREVLPRSILENRLRSNDGNPYHYGLVPRIVALQMIAEQYSRWNHHNQQLFKLPPQQRQKVIVSSGSEDAAMFMESSPYVELNPIVSASIMLLLYFICGYRNQRLTIRCAKSRH